MYLQLLLNIGGREGIYGNWNKGADLHVVVKSGEVNIWAKRESIWTLLLDLETFCQRGSLGEKLNLVSLPFPSLLGFFLLPLDLLLLSAMFVKKGIPSIYLLFLLWKRWTKAESKVAQEGSRNVRKCVPTASRILSFFQKKKERKKKGAVVSPSDSAIARKQESGTSQRFYREPKVTLKAWGTDRELLHSETHTQCHRGGKWGLCGMAITILCQRGALQSLDQWKFLASGSAMWMQQVKVMLVAAVYLIFEGSSAQLHIHNQRW